MQSALWCQLVFWPACTYTDTHTNEHTHIYTHTHTRSTDTHANFLSVRCCCSQEKKKNARNNKNWWDASALLRPKSLRSKIQTPPAQTELAYKYSCMHALADIHINVYVCAYIYISCMRALTDIRMFMCVCVYIHIYIYRYGYIHTYIYLYIYMYIYTCMYICVYIHISRATMTRSEMWDGSFVRITWLVYKYRYMYTYTYVYVCMYILVYACTYMQSGMHAFDVTDCVYALDNTFWCVEITVIGTSRHGYVEMKFITTSRWIFMCDSTPGLFLLFGQCSDFAARLLRSVQWVVR